MQRSKRFLAEIVQSFVHFFFNFAPRKNAILNRKDWKRRKDRNKRVDWLQSIWAILSIQSSL